MGRNIYLGWMQSTQVDFVFKTFDRKTVAKLIQTILSKNTKPYLNPVFWYQWIKRAQHND